MKFAENSFFIRGVLANASKSDTTENRGTIFMGVNIWVAKFLFQHLLGLQFVWVPFSLGAFSFLNNHYLHIPWVSFTFFSKFLHLE